MCQAIPRRILQVDGARLEVDLDGTRAWVEAHTLPDLVVGQYVIVHAGQAPEQIPEAEALEVLFGADRRRPSFFRQLAQERGDRRFKTAARFRPRS
jgi:hydrogenase expression/formation protein HypC